MAEILLLHPGEMGSSIGAALRSKGHTVYWVAEGRSQETHRRASGDDLHALPKLVDGLANVQVIVSICPPESALQVATEVHRFAYQGIYLDANATSPATADKIARLFGDQYVDGGIIGPPARQANSTRLYLSGKLHRQIGALFEDTLVTTIGIDEGTHTASALKMCYASYTKGTSALLLALRALAEHHGITETLLAEWSTSQPGLEQRSTNAAPGTSRKGWRFVGEMQEISRTYLDAGLPGGFHAAAAEIYQRMTAFKDQPPAAIAEVMQELLKVES